MLDVYEPIFNSPDNFILLTSQLVEAQPAIMYNIYKNMKIELL